MPPPGTPKTGPEDGKSFLFRSLASAARPYERTKLYDFAAALPLIAFYGWGVWRNWPLLVERYFITRYGYVDRALAADTLALVLSMLFSALLIALLVFRTVPTAKAPGLFPRFAALAGTFLVLALVWLPPGRIPLSVATLSVGFILFGTVTTIVALLWLGRSFSIMPEARKLVTRGPYALVRHPVYLFEEITVLGIMLQHVQPWSFLLFAAQLAFQLTRIHYEEKVLAARFPEYKDYAARTARLVPGVY